MASTRFNLMGTSFGGKVVLWLALQWPDLVRALVLEAPAAIRPGGTAAGDRNAEEIARRICMRTRNGCRRGSRRNRRTRRACWR